ncbi:MAG: hypothetical protein AAF843_19105, partial [Bacteroidota bacterium]
LWKWGRKHTVIQSLIFASIRILTKLQQEVIAMENLRIKDTLSGTLPFSNLFDICIMLFEKEMNKISERTLLNS